MHDRQPGRTDEELVQSSLGGDRRALDELVRRHQPWIYNLVMRMAGNVEDAEDATQETLVKAITHLSSFRGDSAFRTWLYRIASNHALTMTMRRREYGYDAFRRYGKVIDSAPALEWPDEKSLPAERRVLLEETKIGCMMGTLRCLNRRQRLVFILGGVLGVDSTVGADILEMRAANFRQVLSRSRHRVASFLEGRCGLMNPGNSCRCERKTVAALAAGYVDAEDLQYAARPSLGTVRHAIGNNIRELRDLVACRAQELYRDHPFWEPPDFVSMLRNVRPG